MRTTNKYEIILLAATKLISKKGYSATALQDVADEVGLHKSTLFHYIKSKEDLLIKILQGYLDEADSKLRQILNSNMDPLEKIRNAFRNHLTHITEHLDYVNIFLSEMNKLSRANQEPYMRKRKEYEHNFVTIVSEVQLAGYFEDLDPKVVTLGLLGMLNWVTKWYRADRRLSTTDIADTFYKMIFSSREYKVLKGEGEGMAQFDYRIEDGTAIVTLDEGENHL